VGLLPVGLGAHDLSGALLLAEEVRGAHGCHFHGEQLLDGEADLDLGRMRRDLENDLARLGDMRALLGDERGLDDSQILTHQLSLASMASSASCATTRFLCRRMSYTLMPSTGST